MTVGWYVHHHGAGHRQRFAAVAGRLPGVTGLGSLPAPEGFEDRWVELAHDVPDGEPEDPTAGGQLHYAPLHGEGLRERMAAVAAWIARERPRALVVDVSVEVALLGRLLGVPTVLVAQRGVRTDAPHRTAYASAAAIAAPWTAATHLPGDGPPDDRLAFVGAISRLDDLPPVPPASGRDVLVLVGAGGHGLDPGALHAAAEQTPGRAWHVAGSLRPHEHPRIVDHGPRADVRALLAHTAVVVGTAGGNVVAEVAAARRPFVCLPQDRPFAEQARQGEALRRLGAAEVLDAAPADWAAALDRAERRDTGRWGLLHDGRGAERLAAVVERVAAGSPVCA